MKEQFSTVNVGSVPPDIIEELEGGTVLLGFLDCEAARAAGATQATVESVPAWRLCRPNAPPTAPPAASGPGAAPLPLRLGRPRRRRVALRKHGVGRTGS